MPDPKQTAKADQFHGAAKDVLDGYVTAIGDDMQRFKRSHGQPMDDTFAHNDLTKILERDVPPHMLAGCLAEAIFRLCRPVRRGK